MPNSNSPRIDAFLLVSFGGPEGPDDVIPFLENVLRGRNVPRERLLEVAKHYDLFGGISPINSQNRRLISELEKEFQTLGVNLPIYFGNRNWHPLLTDTIREMRDDGIKHGLALVTSAYSSYSSCRQYRENIADAQQQAGDNAPQIDKLRAFYNHPLFIEANADHIRLALNELAEAGRAASHLLFTAHSIPKAMADNCAYERQLNETCRLVAEAVGHTNFQLVYQSRSGPPTQPWLGPDICDQLRVLKEQAVTDVVVAPIGFVSDHMEVIYDLDTEAKQLASELGINMVRAKTAGTHPLFVKMIRLLVEERLSGGDRNFIGMSDTPELCEADCCPKC